MVEKQVGRQYTEAKEKLMAQSCGKMGKCGENARIKKTISRSKASNQL